MENRFSRASSQRSATASEIDDALYPAYHNYQPGPSLTISTSGRRPVPSPSRGYALARSSSPENVFADPADSPPPSPSGSAFYSNSIVTPTPSIRRPSLSLSARRSPSPLPVANGGYYPHHRLSQSLTPSIRSSSSSTYGHGNGLNRSNTTGTTGTGYSTLSSIPSNLSDFTSPPSPLPHIAPVRPQWNYGGHQQSIYPESINTGSVVPEEMDDPFADDFMIPVADGFALHHQIPPPALVFPSGSSVGSIEPPPYTRYPEQPKPEEPGATLIQQVSNGDSGIDVGQDAEEGRRGSRHGGLAPVVGGVELIAGAGRIGGRGGGGGEPDDDGSGARKEWNERRWMGFKLKVVILGLAIGLLVLLAVGLGAGLGVGLNHGASPATTVSTVYSVTTTDLPPTSEQTGPPVSEPNKTYPAIPTGLALISPLLLTDESSSCDIIAEDPSAPEFSSMGADLFWSCQFDQRRADDVLSWRFDRFPMSVENMEAFDSEPDFLTSDEYGEGSWGGYLVSSFEGIQRWEDDEDFVVYHNDGTKEELSGKTAWRDGMQNQAFWRIPLAFYNSTENNPPDKKLAARSGSRYSAGLRSRTDYPLDDSYKFGILFNKTVIVKDSTIKSNKDLDNGIIKTGNGTALVTAEIVWKCVWEKTLLEVEVMVDIPSQAFIHGKKTDNDDGDDYYDHDYPHPPDKTYESSQVGSPSPSCYPKEHSQDDSLGLGAKQQSAPTGDLQPRSGHQKSKQRRELQKFSYPLKVSMKESRPHSRRLRQLQGMDLTDPDPEGHAEPGAVRCTQYVVGPMGGLIPFVDEAGEGFIVLREEQGVMSKKERLRERGELEVVEGLQLRERDGDCFCRWNS